MTYTVKGKKRYQTDDSTSSELELHGSDGSWSILFVSSEAFDLLSIGSVITITVAIKPAEVADVEPSAT